MQIPCFSFRLYIWLFFLLRFLTFSIFFVGWQSLGLALRNGFSSASFSEKWGLVGRDAYRLCRGKGEAETSEESLNSTCHSAYLSPICLCSVRNIPVVLHESFNRFAHQTRLYMGYTDCATMEAIHGNAPCFFSIPRSLFVSHSR